MEAFWTIVCYAVVLGIPALGGYLFYWWFVLLPRQLAEERGQRR